MDNEEFEMPDSIDVARHETGIIRAKFGYDGRPDVDVFLDQNRCVSLVALLHDKIGNDQVTPISRSRVFAGQMIEVQGHGIRRLPNGTVEITLLAVVDGRRVSVPFEIPKDGIQDFVNRLSQTD
ncbi:MAG: hypothetical protein H6887_11920 [Hoeflea sp.]|nr:hypothetical protein [Hoeflea sp.]